MQQLENAGPAAGHAPEPQAACAPTRTVQEEEERPIAPGSHANEIMVLEDEAARLEAEAQADGVSEAKRYALRKQAAAAQVARPRTPCPCLAMLPGRSPTHVGIRVFAWRAHSSPARRGLPRGPSWA